VPEEQMIWIIINRLLHSLLLEYNGSDC